jgi:hypothetical protein
MAAVRVNAMAAMAWLRQFLQRESDAARMAFGFAIAGHVLVALLLIVGAFEKDTPVATVTIPVGIVMEKPVAPDSPPPAPVPNEQNPWPSVPVVADTDKRSKAPLASLDVNGIDLPKPPGHDGGDRSRDPAGIQLPPADGEQAAGAESMPSWAMHVAPIGPAPPEATTHEQGEDEITAIKEEKLECGLKAMRLSPTAAVRNQARVIGFVSQTQTLSMIRSSQLMADRHIDPRYLRSQHVFAEKLDGSARFTVALPAGLSVNVGDVIEADQGYVNPADPCHYIPNVAVSKF